MLTRLLIVARNREDCYRRFRNAFADDVSMAVIYDRRASSPHSARPGVGGAPGGRERRRHDISDALLRDGWARVKVEEAPPGGAAAPAGPAQILLVDDDLVVLEMLRDILREEGFAPWVTADPREAMAWLRAQGFDLVITDMVMPHVDGLHLVEQVKTRSPKTAVVLMSAFKTDQLVSDAFRLGASAFITKPFELAPFIATIREMVASRAR